MHHHTDSTSMHCKLHVHASKEFTLWEKHPKLFSNFHMTCLCIQATTNWYAHNHCRAPLSTRVLTQVLSEEESQCFVLSVSPCTVCMYMYCVDETLCACSTSDHACSSYVQQTRLVISTAVLSTAPGVCVCALCKKKAY